MASPAGNHVSHIEICLRPNEFNGLRQARPIKPDSNGSMPAMTAMTDYRDFRQKTILDTVASSRERRCCRASYFRRLDLFVLNGAGKFVAHAADGFDQVFLGAVGVQFAP